MSVGPSPSVLILLLLASSALAGDLRREAEDFLARLSSRGYTMVAMRQLELELMEPCTLRLFPPEGTCAEGYYAGLGGNNILDLYLRLEGEGWFLEDTFPDDVPVLRVDSAALAGGGRLIVCALDMIRGATVDSAVVVWAYEPVDRNF